MTVTFLPTKADYVRFRESILKTQISGKQKLCFILFGVLFYLAGIACFLVGEKMIGGFAFLAGVICCLYFPFFLPLFVKVRAGYYFDHNGEKMYSVSFVFSPQQLQIISDRYTLSCPYEMFDRIIEGEEMFLFAAGFGEFNYLPKRAMQPQELETVRSFINQVKSR